MVVEYFVIVAKGIYVRLSRDGTAAVRLASWK